MKKLDIKMSDDSSERRDELAKIWRDKAATMIDEHKLMFADLETSFKKERDAWREQCEKLAEALESARGWVSTHAMQTYSSVASKEVENINQLLENFKEMNK